MMRGFGRWVAEQVIKWQKRNMCKCDSPFFEVKDGMLKCRNCGRPLHRSDVVI